MADWENTVLRNARVGVRLMLSGASISTSLRSQTGFFIGLIFLLTLIRNNINRSLSPPPIILSCFV